MSIYGHGISIVSAMLPEGWPNRTMPVCDPVAPHGKTDPCIAVHDLAASKLAACREKDRGFVRLLLIEKMVEARLRMERIPTMNLEEPLGSRLLSWVQLTVEDLQ